MLDSLFTFYPPKGINQHKYHSAPDVPDVIHIAMFAMFVTMKSTWKPFVYKLFVGYVLRTLKGFMSGYRFDTICLGTIL